MCVEDINTGISQLGVKYHCVLSICFLLDLYSFNPCVSSLTDVKTNNRVLLLRLTESTPRAPLIFHFVLFIDQLRCLWECSGFALFLWLIGHNIPVAIRYGSFYYCVLFSDCPLSPSYFFICFCLSIMFFFGLLTYEIWYFFFSWFIRWGVSASALDLACFYNWLFMINLVSL